MKKSTKRKPEIVLEEYKENEDVNYHAENYLLLAKEFDDKEAEHIAYYNLDYANRFGSPNEKLHILAHELCNPYYYKLKQLLK